MTALIIIGSVLVFFILLFLFLIFPATRKHKDLENLNGIFIAHRGLHNKDNGIPENSLPAFKEAVNYGFAIENDIHLTKDGFVVVFHDDNISRMCGIDKKIKDMTLDEIKELRLLNTEHTIPTLKECLDLVDGKVPLLIEFKYENNTSELCRKANEILKDYKGLYFVQSFHPQILRWYKKNNKAVCRGQLADTFKGEGIVKRLAGMLIFNFLSRPDFVSYAHSGKNYFPFRLSKKLGAFPVGWTFRNKEETEKSKEDFKTFIFENYIPDIKK